MDFYTLIAIGVVTAGVVAGFIAWLTHKSANKVVDTAGLAVTAPVEAAENVATKVVDTVRASTEPVAKGFANILNSIAGNIEARREDLAKLRVEIRNLTQENERLKNRQISVEPIKQIFEVAFFRLPIRERNFVREVLKTSPGGALSRNEEIEYLGVYRANNTQKYGVDFEALRFRIRPDSVIEIGGVGRTKLIGNIDTKVECEFTELRKHLTGGPLADSREIVVGDVGCLMLQRSQKQHDELLADISRDKRVEEIERGVELLTMQHFKNYFAPRGFTVIKVDGDLTDGKSLTEIRDEINAGLNALISDTDKRLAITLEKTEAVEREIHGEIQKLRDTKL